jgi:hypothetical protein
MQSPEKEFEFLFRTLHRVEIPHPNSPLPSAVMGGRPVSILVSVHP